MKSSTRCHVTSLPREFVHNKTTESQQRTKFLLRIFQVCPLKITNWIGELASIMILN